MTSRSVRASIDLGTNTCLLLIAECDEVARAVTKVVHDQSTVVRLGQGVDKNRQFAPEACERTLAALRGYVDKMRSHGVDPTRACCVATSQARDARNGAEFFERVQRETGLRFKTISGDDEATFTFYGGLLPGMSPERSAVIDIGGGSTEFMSARGGQSLDIGAVRYTERFLKSDPVTDEEFWACQEAIDAELERLTEWRKSLPSDTKLVGVAGTVTTLGAWHLALERYDAAKLDSLELSRGDVHRCVEELKFRTVAERRELPGMEKGREDVLLAGSMILWRAMEVLDFKSVTVSTRGLRFGALLREIGAQ